MLSKTKGRPKDVGIQMMQVHKNDHGRKSNRKRVEWHGMPQMKQTTELREVERKGSNKQPLWTNG